MLVAGVDPGAIMTGLAIHDGTRFVCAVESEEPTDIWETLEYYSHIDPAIVIVVEAFLGTGRLNKRRIRTIEIVGYIYNRARENGLAVERMPSQARLPCVSLVPANIKGKDERAAAAHALAYLERTDQLVFDIKRGNVQRRSPANRSGRRSPVRKNARS